MTAQVLKIVRAAASLECSACGATADASCDCGLPYVPAGARAAAAVAANPEKSDRAIAAEIGVDRETISRARKNTTGGMPPVDARIGLDGKVRRLPQRQPVEDAEPGIEDDIDGEDPGNYRTAYLLRVDQAVRFASYSGAITQEIVDGAYQVIAAWSKLAKKMEKSV